MIDLVSLEKATHMTKPRRVRKYVLIWCASGKATIEVDDGVFDLSTNTVITITSGQVHCLRNSKNAKGYVLEFTYDFFCKSDADIELIFHNSLFCHFAMNEIISLGENKLVAKELELIATELERQPFQYLTSVRSRIELILVEINREKLKQGGEIYKPDALFLKFLEAVFANFDKKMSVQQFASSLGTTGSKLNELSKFHTGRTAQQVIHGLIAAEAKRLLRFENLSVKEVAFALGFDDPFYFSNFFKKQTGLAPSSFVEENSS